MIKNPIQEVTNKLQYRAIGIVKAIYKANNKEQINRGTLTDKDGKIIDTVILGKALSLIKKYIHLSNMALLSEVYGKDFAKREKKPRKDKKRVKASQNVPLSPMDPQEMDKELLYDVFDDSLRPSEKVRGLKTSVYSDEKNVYQPIQNPNVLTYENQFDVFEDQPARLAKTMSLGFQGEDATGEKPGTIDILNDPDYQEYVMFKKAQRAKTQGLPVGYEGFADSSGQGEQFRPRILKIGAILANFEPFQV